MRLTFPTSRRAAAELGRFVAFGIVLCAAVGRAETAGSRSGDIADPFSAPCQRVQIRLTADAVAHLRMNPRTDVEAIVTLSGNVLHRVMVHLKGADGSFRPIDDKPSWTLDFGKSIPGHGWGGVRKIHLNNSVEDLSYLREAVGAAAFTAGGVPAPRVSHAVVELNGTALGLYVLKEGFTEEFLTRHFGQGDGILYEKQLGHDVDGPLKPHSNSRKGPGDQQLQRLAAVAREPDLSRRWTLFESALDLESFLNFMALEILICHWDGYCLGQNNYRIYQHPESGRFTFLPSGMDQILNKPDLAWNCDMSGLVARAILEIPAGRERFETQLKRLARAPFFPKLLLEEVDRRLDGLRSGVSASEFRRLTDQAAELRNLIEARHADLERQFTQPALKFPTFAKGRAMLNAWEPVPGSAAAKLEQITLDDGTSGYRIAAEGRTSAAWRSTVLLNPGQYRFRAEVQVRGVAPLPFGKNQGAGLRVLGRDVYSSRLTGSTIWQTLEVLLRMTAAGPVELICELRADAGEAWFRNASLLREGESNDF